MDKEILRLAFDAGAAYTTGSHELFEQTHPDFAQWYREIIINKQEKENE